jgi:hypothetical protein
MRYSMTSLQEASLRTVVLGSSCCFNERSLSTISLRNQMVVNLLIPDDVNCDTKIINLYADLNLLLLGVPN